MSSILPRKGCSDKEGERAITLRPTVKGSQWMGLPTTAFEAARAQQEKIVQTQPDYGPALCVLGLIDAVLGRKELALHEGRRAIALTRWKRMSSTAVASFSISRLRQRGRATRNLPCSNWKQDCVLPSHRSC